MNRKRIILLSLFIVVVFAGAISAYLWNSVAGGMKPAATGEITDGVFAVRSSFVNQYLVKGTDGYIAIDTGNNSGTVEKELEKLGIKPGEVKAVFLTHSDYDHVGGIKLFPDAKVYLSVAEEQMINGTTPRGKDSYNKLEHAYELLEDNQTTDICGISVRGILVPGHTPGSMAYLINGGYLFTGDTMSLKNEKSGMFVAKFNMDAETEAASNRRIAGMTGVEWIFTGHHGYTNDFAAAFVQ